MSRLSGAKGRWSRSVSVYELPDHQDQDASLRWAHRKPGLTGRNFMQTDVGVSIGKLLVTALILAVFTMAGWSYYNKRNKPGYMGNLSSEVQLEIELELKLAEIAIANKAKTDPWYVYESVSSRDDSEYIAISTNAVMPVSIRGGLYQTPRMIIRCLENVTSVLVSFETFIGSRDRRVEYRVDEKPLQRGTWSASTDNKMVGLWHGAQAIPFVKLLLGGESVKLWLTPLNSQGVIVTFNVKSLGQHIEKVAEACNWSID